MDDRSTEAKRSDLSVGTMRSPELELADAELSRKHGSDSLGDQQSQSYELKKKQTEYGFN